MKNPSDIPEVVKNKPLDQVEDKPLKPPDSYNLSLECDNEDPDLLCSLRIAE